MELKTLSNILPDESFDHQKITPFQYLINNINDKITVVGAVAEMGMTTLLIDLSIKLVQTKKSKGLAFFALKDHHSEIHNRFNDNMFENLVEESIGDNIILNPEKPTGFIELLNIITEATANNIDTIVIDNLNNLLVKFNEIEIKSFFDFIYLMSNYSGIRFIIGDTMSDAITKRTGFKNRMPRITDITYPELKRIANKTFTLSRLTYYGMATNIDAYDTINTMQVSIYDCEEYTDEITLKLANQYSYQEAMDIP